MAPSPLVPEYHGSSSRFLAAFWISFMRHSVNTFYTHYVKVKKYAY